MRDGSPGDTYIRVRMRKRSFTAIVEKDGFTYVATCPELAIVSQGATVDEAVWNLRAAVELFLAAVDSAEAEKRLSREVTVVEFEVEEKQG